MSLALLLFQTASPTPSPASTPEKFPAWLTLIKVVVLFAFGVVMTLFMINWERKVVGRMQHRPGPNRVGPKGWLQSLADGLREREDHPSLVRSTVPVRIEPIADVLANCKRFALASFSGVMPSRQRQARSSSASASCAMRPMLVGNGSVSGRE